MECLHRLFLGLSQWTPSPTVQGDSHHSKPAADTLQIDHLTDCRGVTTEGLQDSIWDAGEERRDQTELNMVCLLEELKMGTVQCKSGLGRNKPQKIEE